MTDKEKHAALAVRAERMERAARAKGDNTTAQIFHAMREAHLYAADHGESASDQRHDRPGDKFLLIAADEHGVGISGPFPNRQTAEQTGMRLGPMFRTVALSVRDIMEGLDRPCVPMSQLNRMNVDEMLN